VAIRLAERARGGREVPTDREMRSPSQIAPHRELMESLLRLPAMQRAAVILRYLEERPIPEVAAILGCAEPTARVHLHRGRNRLREILQEVSDVDG
jgi:RNA polymerase sigma factor (sigma-70 family)